MIDQAFIKLIRSHNVASEQNKKEYVNTLYKFFADNPDLIQSAQLIDELNDVKKRLNHND